MSIRSSTGVALLALAVTGCGEKPQTAGTAKKVDAKAWEASQTSHLATGWKGSDQAAWEAQIRQRAQGQNEYSRVAAAAAPAAAPIKTP